jgi:hypothetical protein
MSMLRLPRSSLRAPSTREQVHMNPPARHFELVADIGEAMGIASAIHRGRLADVVEHLCLDHIAEQLGAARSFRLAALIAVDRCRRPCHRCEQAAAEQAAAQKATRAVAL